MDKRNIKWKINSGWWIMVVHNGTWNGYGWWNGRDEGMDIVKKICIKMNNYTHEINTNMVY